MSERGRADGRGRQADATNKRAPRGGGQCSPPSSPSYLRSLSARSPYSDHIDVVLPALGLRLAAVDISLPRSRLSTGRSTQTVGQTTHPQTGFAIVVSNTVNNKQGPPEPIFPPQKRPSRLKKDETKASSSKAREKEETRERPAGSYIARKQHFAFTRSSKSFFNQVSTIEFSQALSCFARRTIPLEGFLITESWC